MRFTPRQSTILVSLRRLLSYNTVRALLLFLLLLLRSHARLFHPQVWAEDGTPSFAAGGSNIPDFLHYGWAALFRPINGYLILLPKAISGISLAISFLYYPTISTILAWAATVFMLVVIASGKVQLRGGIWLSILALLIPSDPEVFGLSLYTFWWTILLLFAVILWQGNSDDLKWRLPIVFVTGLSSPVVVGTVPIFFLRALIYRKRWQECAVSGLASACGVVQLAVWQSCGIKFPARRPITTEELAQSIPTFLGRYFIGNLFHSRTVLWIAGLTLAFLIAYGVSRFRSNLSYWVTLYLYAASVAMVMHRVAIVDLHPVLAGPRYFFLPFVITSWLLVQFWCNNSSRIVRTAALIILTISVINSIPVLTRRNDELYWRANVFSCPFFDHYAIPISYDGLAYHTWQLRLKGTECRSLIDHDIFRNLRTQPAPFPYTVFTIDLVEYRRSLASIGSLLGHTWKVTNSEGPRLPDLAVVGESNGPSSGQSIILELRKGQSVLYRTDPPWLGLKVLIDHGQLPFAQRLQPTSSWRYLVFSNSELPERFTVTFENQEGKQGMPVAIGLAKNE